MPAPGVALKRRRRRFALPALAAAGSAALAAAIVWLALGDERDLAESYRATLAVAGYRLEAVLGDGSHARAFPAEVGGDGNGSAGAAIGVDYDEVAEIRLLYRDGREVAEADLGE